MRRKTRSYGRKTWKPADDGRVDVDLSMVPPLREELLLLLVLVHGAGTTFWALNPPSLGS